MNDLEGDNPNSILLETLSPQNQNDYGRDLLLGQNSAKTRYEEVNRQNLINAINEGNFLEINKKIIEIQKSKDPLKDIRVIKDIVIIISEYHNSIKIPASKFIKQYFSTIELHFRINLVNCAAWLADPQFMAMLLVYPVALVDSKYNNLTPLNILSRNLKSNNYDSTFECIKLLIDYGANPNLPNEINKTPIFYVADNPELEYSEKDKIIVYFLLHSDIELDIETEKLIKEKFPHYISIIPETVNRLLKFSPEQFNVLISCLNNSLEVEFLQQFEEFYDSNRGTNYSYNAYEQYLELFILSMKHDLHQAFQLILGSGLNINFRYQGCTPINMACFHDKPQSLYILLNCRRIKIQKTDNLLITVIEFGSIEIANDQCLNILLNSKKIDINQTDHKGYSALHYAIFEDLPNVIDELLKRGAYIGVKNIFDEFAISKLPPDIIEKCLDSCIRTNGKLSWEKDFSILIDYKNLIPPKKQQQFLTAREINTEMEAVHYIAQLQQLRHLLHHPLISTFLHLKWNPFLLIFNLNLLFCFILWLLLCILGFCYVDSDHTPTWLYGTSLIVVLYLIIRESVQLIMSPNTYIKNYINYLEIIFIILIILTITAPNYHWYTNVKNDLAVSTILLSILEISVILSSLPATSTNMLMLKKVSYSFLKIILNFSYMIIGFSVCFTISYSDRNSTGKNITENDYDNEEESSSDINKFLYPYATIVKMLVMMTGEFDASDINLYSSILSYILFPIFLFSIAIAFNNLLSALAVGDTQVIREEAKLLGLINLTTILYKYDCIFTQNNNNNEPWKLWQIEFQNPRHFIRTKYQEYFLLFKNNTLSCQTEIINFNKNKANILQYLAGKWFGYKTQKNIFKTALSKIEQNEKNIQLNKKSSDFLKKLEEENKKSCKLIQEKLEMKIDSLNFEDHISKLEMEHKEKTIENDHLFTKYEKKNVKIIPTKGYNEQIRIGYFQLFRFATQWEIFLLFLGLIVSAIKASALPIEIIIYGEFTAMLVDRNYRFGTTSKTNLLPIMGGGNILTNASRAENNEELYNDSIAYARLLLIVTFFLFISGIFAVDIFNYVALKQITRMRIQFFSSTIRQDIGWHDITKNQNFALRITDEIDKIRDGISEKISHFIVLLISFTIVTSTSFVYGWKLSLVVSSYIPIAFATNYLVTKYQSKLTTRELNSYAKCGSLVEEILTGIRTVIAFGGEKIESKKYDDYLNVAKKAVIQKGTFTGLGAGVLNGLLFISSAGAFWYGIQLILADRDNVVKEYSPAILMIVVFGIICGAFDVGRCGPFLESFATARGSASTIFNIIDSKSNIDPLSPIGYIPNGQIIGDIEFQNVYFNYPSRKDITILKGLNIKIESGKTVALVGSSGCGKSTCIQLMQRFYDPNLGKILLDGKDIKKYNISWLRSNIAVVGQESALFQGTIGENIMYGKSNANQKEIEDAAKEAGAHEFIMKFPNGYDTWIGEKGTQLSGGQKQRIAIARALIQNPKILLLDEATSALDYKTEKLVQDALDVASKNRTTIVVSHRLSAIKGADKIIFIEKGTVIEEGSPDVLMKQNGRYTQMVNSGKLKMQESDILIDVRKNSLVHRKSINLDTIKIETDDVIDMKQFSELDCITVAESTKSSDRLINVNYQQSLIRLFDIARPIKVQCICALLSSFLIGATYPSFSICFGEFYAIMAEPNEDVSFEKTKRLSFIVIIIGIVTGFVCVMQMYFFNSCGAWITARIRSIAFKSILRQDIGWFDSNKNSVGALSARLSGDAANIQGAIGFPLSYIFQGISHFILGISISYYYSWELASICLLLSPLMIVANLFEGKYMEKTIIQEKEVLEEASRIATEAINNIRTIASLRREKQIIEKYTKEIFRVEYFLRRKLRYRGLVNSFANALMYFVYSIALTYGGILVSKEKIPFQDIIKISELLIFSSTLFSQSLAFLPAITSALIASHRLFELIDSNPRITSSVLIDKKISKETKFPEVKYDRITFSYPTRPNVQILEGLDLIIPQRKTVALVGHSGCGKSTCIQLLQRFYDPDDGIININDENIKTEISLHNLRSNLGIVSQEPILFERTIAENIAYGDNKRDVSIAEIIVSAKQANAHSFITTLPLGYDTQLGAHGTQLSGGEKQRIAIARALIRQPKILLLDEATSALDLKSERIVQSALDAACSDRTCIIIAHRLSTVQNADLICVFENGKIVEQGNHNQLLVKNGIYSELYKINENIS